ncbi:MAG: hypothetical protein GXP62_13465 [Oligoflexia bacterium]|nr:hypothetical protein [Oligoflexia bacterium]
MRWALCRLLVIGTLLACVLVGSARAGQTDTVPQPTADSAAAPYRVGAGDVLSIQVYGEPSLSGSFAVDASQSIDYPLLGRIEVTGLTTPGLVDLLCQRLMAGFILSPNVTVSVKAYHSQPIQVLGAVVRPGIYFLEGPTSVMEILSRAGGVAPQGVNEVRITHGTAGAVTVLPYDQLLSQDSDATTLSAGDIVFVPQSMVSVVGEVDKPGDVAFREGLTVSHCIAAVGGALPAAALRHVYIMRGERRVRVNLRRVLSGKAPDVMMQPSDRIFVPQSVF